MHCLLCHEKIPRLRAWTGKSEFCCDEHAELYKKQTMDRLLVDDSTNQSAPSALPILDLTAPAPGAVSASVDHVLLKDQSKKATLGSEAQQSEEVDELWKLAERMGAKEKAPSSIQLPGISEVPQGSVEEQSAEEALEALQALAAQTPTQDSLSDGDLLEEFSNLESSFEDLPELEALSLDLERVELEDAPEFELDALELAEEQAETAGKPELVVQSAEPEAIDAPDLLLEDLAEAQAEALEPPEFAAEFAAEPESLEPPDVSLDELLAEPKAAETQGSELADPPEPEDFGMVAAEEAELARPAAPLARRAPKAAPNLRPATELQEMSPSPTFPEDRYTLKPWSDALAVAGPDRASLLGPVKFIEMRKSSLNGTASAKFDPVQFRASERAVSVAVPIMEPKHEGPSFPNGDGALRPCLDVAWPAPLHAALTAAEMSLVGASQGEPSAKSVFSLKQPTLSAEFLSSVALQSQILEPRSSAILSPRERDGFASAAAGEEVSDSYASAAGRSDRDETDGGERAHVADLF